MFCGVISLCTMSFYKVCFDIAAMMFLLYLLFFQPVSSTPSKAFKAKSIRSPVDLHVSYDFVIVGGGASGLTVADRLTEDPSKTVLVLEYGPFDTHEPSVLVPGLLNLTSTPYWFNLTSTAQPHLNNRTFQVTIAAAVGGGTVINGMFFHRGAEADYDAWEELGARGWGWSDLLPYFKGSETFTPPNASFAREWGIEWEEHLRGTQGPLQISYPPYQFPIIKDFFRAFHSLGITTPRDSSDGRANGVFWAPSTLDPVERTRSYARTAHYDRVAKKRPNYHILPMSSAIRILFDASKKAVGVEYVSRASNKTSRVRADKEVILAAGAVHTPQLLLLSGIGEKQELEQHGIECISDVPGVGHNFQDHPTMFFINTFEDDIDPSIDDLTSNQTFISEQLALYEHSREGAYTIVNNGGNTAAFVALPQMVASATLSKLLNYTTSRMDTTLPYSIQSLYTHQHTIQMRQLATNNTSVQETAFNKGFLPITLLHPLSRGRISLNAIRPLSAPLVDYSTLSHPLDSEIFVQMLRFNRRLLQMPSLAALQPRELVPGANVSTDEMLKNVLPGLVQPTFQHPCCTAAMGKRAHGGVVDPESLLVWDVHGLSIVDASLMPMIVGAHLMATVYGVAEKAADMIKRRHGIAC
ncbi:hypothetical protein HBH70_110800 [Parastagonospora nodorum]|nr:hypothetical protein HBH47_094280 [Parastagonospora nodorum]KAH4294205.1 hypothetical protein HBI01_165230 [Parastagonospora nodorum]KAH4297314.1 hypothetical protein HBI02_164360 [Parastagonospora nodorum]KAH4325636.1 hypothetical protein HBI00_151920 [Parastagonospora nodorum]KAH4363212.1 hypothetical protein HBH94_171310 [Parastagonospora nodorum]